MNTQFGYLCNFYLFLISFSKSTLQFVINVPQYYWQMHTYKDHVQKICLSNFNIVTTLIIIQVSTKTFSEMEYFQHHERVNIYTTMVGI